MTELSKFYINDKTLPWLDEMIFIDMQEKWLQCANINIQVLFQIYEELSAEEWTHLVTLLINEQYEKLLIYIQVEKPDIWELYLKQLGYHKLEYLTRSDVTSTLTALPQHLLERIFNDILVGKEIESDLLYDEDALYTWLWNNGFTQESCNELYNLAIAQQKDPFICSLAVIGGEDDNHIFQLRVHGKPIYNQVLHREKHKLFAYHLLINWTSYSETVLAKKAMLDPKLMAFFYQTMQQDEIVYNTSREKTYIHDLECFVDICTKIGVTYEDIVFFLNDDDVRQYISSGEAYFTVKYNNKDGFAKVLLFDYEQQSMVSVVAHTCNLLDVYHILTFFKADNQQYFTKVIDTTFSTTQDF